MAIHKKLVSSTILGAVVFSVPLMAPVTLQAQGVLEEIVVTAQRREQSLQEVPISIETFSGNEISEQGWRDMEELVNFSPTVTVNPDLLRSSITIRGFGSATSDSLTTEQSSPTFVDGIHYGRTSQIKLAFLDLQSVEVLKGPQPVYFGQNAIAGAFNQTTRKPTPVWEGYLNLDYSVNDTLKAEAAAGGPINDTWGIRVAGSYQRSNGYLRDIITDVKFPHYKNIGGRVILRWTPTDNFQATMKFETGDMNTGGQGNHVCQNANPVHGLEIPDIMDGNKVLLDPPYGVGWDVGHRPLGECYASNDGLQTGKDLPPPPTVWEGAGRQGQPLLNVIGTDHLVITPEGFRTAGKVYEYGNRENIEPWNTYLDLSYTLANGIVLNSLTGYDYYYREYYRDNRGSPFHANFQNREEDQYSISQEIRVSSPGGGMFEWMVGAYYQQVDYDIWSDSVRPNTRTGRRYNEGWEDAEWKSLFGMVTYNFLDGRASLDVGGRYSNSWKETFVQSWGAQWILFDGRVIPFNMQIPPFGASGGQNTACAAVGVPGVTDCAGLFTYYNSTRPIGITEPRVEASIQGPHLGEADQTEFNPQVSLRYRPNDSTSVYAKYAESFKAAAFNTGQATIPAAEDYGFGPEYGENYEVGIKGDFTLLGNPARYTVTAFYAKITDLQLAEALPNPDNALLRFNNAGAKRTQGTEITVDWLPTDNLALSLSGAYMDGVMADYQGSSCTQTELDNFAVSGCDPVTETIDRSGQRAPGVPEYKVVLDVKYDWPLANGYALSFGGKGYWSSSYRTSLTSENKFNAHGDLNLSAGYGPQGGPWKVSGYLRNIMEPHNKFDPESTLEPTSPISTPGVSRSDFMHYGVQFRYSYN